MIPIYQTILGRNKGNCLPACFASVLEIPIESVPHLLSGDDGLTWIDDYNRWLWGFGLGVMLIKPPDDPAERQAFMDSLTESGGFYIVMGLSESGCQHAIVWHKGKLAHDPMPGGGGVALIDFIIIMYQLNPGLGLMRSGYHGS